MRRDPREWSEELREEATLYALDLLEAGEREAFERHLTSSPTLRAEVRALRETMGGLGDALPALEPPPTLKARLLARIEGGGTPTAPTAPGFHELRGDAGSWRSTGFPGVSWRSLYRDPITRLTTMLLRMDPGTAYPAHRHAFTEQCLVLEGDVTFGGAGYAKGDFVWAEQGSVHPVLHTIGGNLLLVVGSPSDEIVSD